MSVNTIEATTDDAHGSDARERNEWVQDGSKASFNTIRIAAAGPDGNGGRIDSDPRTLRKLLRDSAHSQLPDGRMLGTFPTDRGDADPHYVIEDYALQWVEALRWYHDLTGDTAFVQEMWPTLVAQMQWCLDRIGTRGLLNAREYTSFDNPLAYITCEGANINAFFYQSLRDAAYLGGVIHQTTQANAYTAAADALHSSFNAHLWNAAEQAYSAGYLNGVKLGPTVHAQLMALYSGLVPAARVEATRAWFVENYKNPGAGLVVGPKSNYLEWIANKAGLDMPIMYYWAFSELYRADTAAMDQEAISEMRRRWTNMVNFLQDAGTLSESFVNDQGGGMSESCHNYGAVPAYFLSSFILGPRVNGPYGNRQLIIEPRPGDLTSASGNVVTDLGLVLVSWTQHPDRFQFSCTVPLGKTATLRLPFAGGAVTWNGNAIADPTTEGRYVILPLSSGAHEVSVETPPTVMKTIYEDSLIGNQVTLNGALPTTSSNFAGGSIGAAWNATSSMSQTPSGATCPANAAAFLPISIQPGYIYHLEATLSSDSTWTAIGFSDSPASGEWHTTGNKYAWTLVRAPGAGAPQFFGGAGTAHLQSWTSQADGTRTVSITLDTTATNWTAFATIDGVKSSTATFTANPAISRVGFGGYREGGGIVKDFRLTATTDNPPPYIRTDDHATGHTTVEVPGSESGFPDNLTGRTDFLKTGVGTLMLDAPVGHSGATRILAGTLKLSPGTNILPPATPLSLEASSSAIDLNGATQTIASLRAVPGATVKLGGGTLIISGSSGAEIFEGFVTGSGNLANTGTLRLIGDASLSFSGTFTNNGILDMMTWNGSLPDGFVNNGIVLDRSAVKIDTFAMVGNAFSVTLKAWSGHGYQLQRSESLTSTWQDIGAPRLGDNSVITLTDPEGAAQTRMFYRVSVSP
jgi:autotransporter-associated beta strand protein